MVAVELAARLARAKRADGEDTILFDRALLGFHLHLHKVSSVQMRIEGRNHRVAIAWHGNMGLAEARLRAVFGICPIQGPLALNLERIFHGHARNQHHQVARLPQLAAASHHR